MTPPLLLLLVAFAAANACVAGALLRWRRSAVCVTALVAALFPWCAQASDWMWFDWAKRYSVVLPMFAVAVMNAWPKRRIGRALARIMPFLFIVNVLEAAALDTTGGRWAHGLVLAALALLIPWRFTWDPETRWLGFRDPLWQTAYALSLARLFVLSSEFENSVMPALTILLIPSAVTLFRRDSHGYAEWRIATLYAHLVQDSMWPTLSDALYPTWAHPEIRTKLLPPLAANLWFAVDATLVALILWQRLRLRVSKRAMRDTIDGSLSASVRAGTGVSSQETEAAVSDC